MTFFKSKVEIEIAESTPLSDFVRNASSEEKKKIYTSVLKRAANSQADVIERVSKGKGRKLAPA